MHRRRPPHPRAIAQRKHAARALSSRPANAHGHPRRLRGATMVNSYAHNLHMCACVPQHTQVSRHAVEQRGTEGNREVGARRGPPAAISCACMFVFKCCVCVRGHQIFHHDAQRLPAPPQLEHRARHTPRTRIRSPKNVGPHRLLTVRAAVIGSQDESGALKMLRHRRRWSRYIFTVDTDG